MRYWTSEGAGRVRAVEGDQFFVPYRWRRDGSRYPLVWCHGGGADYAVGPNERAVVEALRVPAIATTQGGVSTWGADSVVGAAGTVEADRAYAVANLGAKDGKALIMGGSMGGLTAVLYALANPTKVAALALFIPALDPEYVRVNNVGGNQAAIQAVHGVGTVPAGKQAYLRGADLAATGIPTKVWHSTTDTFTPDASTQEFIAESGCESVSLGAVGHSYASLVSSQVSDFLTSYVR